MTPATTSTVTATIMNYRNGEATWDDLVSFIKEFPWHDPDLPDSGDWNGWAAGPDTFQTGTWGEVTGLHLDEVLTDDEYFALTDIFDAIGE